MKIQWCAAVAVAVLTFVVFLPALHGEFLNMDDDAYIYNNAFIRTFDLRLLKSAFLEFNVSNWHPLTWFSHALDYAIWGLNPLGHHLTNNIFHAANTFVVVLLMARLIEIAKIVSINNPKSTIHNARFALLVSASVGLLFGVHPIHVESVAWVSERKDVLCAFFFLLSIMMYLKYAGITLSTFPLVGTPSEMLLNKGKDPKNSTIVGNDTSITKPRARLIIGYYILSLFLFILALLSKPMVVTLPLVLLILDWYPLGRITSLSKLRGVVMEKLPFFAFSLASSVITILAQQSGGAIISLEILPFTTRLIVSIQTLVSYLWKMLLPMNLLPVYPYPQDVSLTSLKFFLPVLLTAVITVGVIAVAKRQRLWLAAWGYYVITLLPVIGLIQVGRQPMADRYTYLPGLGPFIIVVLALVFLYKKITLDEKSPTVRLFISFLTLAIFASMIYLTIKQTAVWRDSFTLWNYVILKEPEQIPSAYNQRGLAFYAKGDYAHAIDDFTKATALYPKYLEAYKNRGIAHYLIGNYREAIESFDKAIGLDMDDPSLYANRAYLFLILGNKVLAVSDLRKSCAFGYKEACENLEAISANKITQ